MSFILFFWVQTVNNDKRIQSMKKGGIFWLTLSLLVMTALTGTSSQSIEVLPGPVEVKQGNKVTLWCELKNNSENRLPVHWQSPPNFKTRTSNCDSFVKEKYVISCVERWYNMTIVDVQWDDKGKYRCVHTSHFGVVDLQVLVPVTDVSLAYVSDSIITEPQSINAEFTCATDCAYPAPKISWLENQEPFEVNPINIKTDELGCTGDKAGQKRTISELKIKVEQKKKVSKISCLAENSIGEKISKEIDAWTGTSSQSIRVLPGPVEVKQGNNVTLWCKLKHSSESGLPVHWQSPPKFKTRTINCISFAEKKYLISCAEGRFSWYNLTIVDVQWDDKGKYRCISGNLKVVELKVLVPVTKVSMTHVPRSKKELLFLDKDNNAELTCTTNCAYPAPNISWFENNHPFNGSAEVLSTESGCIGKKKGQKRTKSMVKVIGKYVSEKKKQSNIHCTAENIKAESKVSRRVNVGYNALLTGVRFQNTSTLLSGPVEVKQGNNISLWCKLIDDSAEEPVHWQSPPEFTTRTSNCDTFGSSLVKQKYIVYCAESGDRSYNMTIIDVQWTDNGKYRCLHTRQLGIVELQVSVPVSNLSLTHIPHSKNELLLLGKDSNALLTCTTNCAYPATSISWFENDQPFNGTADVTTAECTGVKKGQKRTISTVTVTGKYLLGKRKQSNISCTAGNVKGEHKVSRTVNVGVNSEVAKPPQNVMAKDDIVAASVVPVLIVIIIVVVIIFFVRRNRKKRRCL